MSDDPHNKSFTAGYTEVFVLAKKNDPKTKDPVKGVVGGWKELPQKLRIAAILCVFLFGVQVSFVTLYLKEHIIGHLLFTFSYISVVYAVFSYQRNKVNRLLEAIDNSNMIAKFTPEGVFQSANFLFCDIMDYEPEELIGNHHKMLVPPGVAESEEYINFWKHLAKGNPWHGTYERIDGEGNPCWVVGSYTPIKGSDGVVYQVVKVARDVTAQMKDRMDLRSKNTYLEHAAKILRHDMHSGINTYMPRGISSLERRLDKCPEIVEKLNLEMPLRLLKEGLKHTQKVYSGVREFTNLVKPGVALETQDYDLKALLSEYLDSTAYKSQVVLSDCLPKAKVNGPLFCTAIDNLIRNGLKYNDSVTKVVKVESLDNKYIAVIDNGRGMTEREFEEYSKPYTRKKGQSESGSGLGLNICIAILREHGFSVTSEKLAESGTLIKIRIKSP